MEWEGENVPISSIALIRGEVSFLATLQKDRDFSRQSCFSMARCIETEVSSSGFHERLISERQNQNKKKQ